MRKQLSFLSSLLAAPAATYAACSSPSGVAGEITYTGSELKYCNDTTWKSLKATSIITGCATAGELSVIGNVPHGCSGGTLHYFTYGYGSNGSCAGTAAGTITKSAGNWLHYCDGSVWKPMPGRCVSTDSVAITHGSTVTMYNVASADTYYGDSCAAHSTSNTCTNDTLSNTSFSYYNCSNYYSGPSDGGGGADGGG